MSKENQTKTGGRDATGGVIPGRFALSVGKPETPTPDGWEWVKLTDVARIETGHTPARKHPEYWDGEISWVGIKDATSNHGFVIDDTFQHVTQKGIDNSSARVLPANTVCLSRTASVGYVIVMGKPMATSQDFVNWVCSEKIDHRYLASILYAENSSFSLFSRGTTHQTIYLPEAKAFHVLLPSIEIQRKIANIVWGMIDKIQLNRQTNQTLEHMAQAIFKSWFVNFEPTRAKIAAKEEWAKRSITAKSGGSDNNIKESQAEATFVERAAMAAISGRAIDSTNDSATGALAGLDQLNPEQIQQLKTTAALFPDTLVDSELGEIPEGWREGCVGDIAIAKGGYAFKGKSFVEKGHPVVKIKNITGDGRVDLSGAVCIDDEQAKSSERFKLKDGNLLMAMTGATVGKIGFVVTEGKSVYLNQRVAKFESEKFGEKAAWFLFCCFERDSIFDLVVGAAQGSAQPNISSTGIESTKIVLPSDDLVNLFCNKTDSLFRKWLAAINENSYLEDQRDTLLPKLLSGDLPI